MKKKIILLLVCFLLALNAFFIPKQSIAEKLWYEEFTESVSQVIFLCAWPTAQYKYSSFKDIDIYNNNIDLTFRIYGQSVWTDSEIWVDVVLTSAIPA